MQGRSIVRILVAILLVLLVAILLVGLGTVIFVRQTTEQALNPINEANQQIRTQISAILNPTPTIIPDPVTIVHEVRALARLETIQYTVEKVITAESGQGSLGFLFGDRLLLVAHGSVIAGVDLGKMGSEDIYWQDDVLHVRLPKAEVFVATLNNNESYIYDRDTGLLNRGEIDLEAQARQAAEEEIRKAALDDNILDQAQVNAENFLSGFLRSLDYPIVVFDEPIEEEATATPAP